MKVPKKEAKEARKRSVKREPIDKGRRNSQAAQSSDNEMSNRDEPEDEELISAVAQMQIDKLRKKVESKNTKKSEDAGSDKLCFYTTTRGLLCSQKRYGDLLFWPQHARSPAGQPIGSSCTARDGPFA